MRQGWRSFRLMTAPRAMLVPIVIAAAAAVFVARFPSLFFFLQDGPGIVPRPVMPVEYASAAVAPAFAVGVAPRFPLWELLGGRRTRVSAAVAVAVTIAVPLAVTAVGLATYPSEGSPPVGALVPVIGNVAVTGAVCSLAVMTGGRLWGSLGAVVVYFGLLAIQNSHPEYGWVLPLTGAYLPNGEVDRTWRAGWIVVTVAAALSVAAGRAGVPLGVDLLGRDDEDGSR